MKTSRTAIKLEATTNANQFYSVSVRFSKGLGAPVGSALCGRFDRFMRAPHIRKTMRGGIRQAGILAAAATQALNHPVQQPQEDLRLATSPGWADARTEGVRLDPVHGNVVVFVNLDGPAQARSQGLPSHLKSHAIRCTGQYRLRFATQSDADEADIEQAGSAIQASFRGAP